MSSAGVLSLLSSVSIVAARWLGRFRRGDENGGDALAYKGAIAQRRSTGGVKTKGSQLLRCVVNCLSGCCGQCRSMSCWSDNPGGKYQGVLSLLPVQWEPTREGYLQFLADSKTLFMTLEDIVNEAPHPDCELSEALA
jgi:hypothetical protein